MSHHLKKQLKSHNAFRLVLIICIVVLNGCSIIPTRQQFADGMLRMGRHYAKTRPYSAQAVREAEINLVATQVACRRFNARSPKNERINCTQITTSPAH
jgi:hypothetical protein